MISIIAACDENCGIGKDGKIPWHHKEDMKLFKSSTMGKTVVMGRKTWKSLNYKELKGRENVILSREPQPLSMDDKYKNVKMFRTIEFLCEYYKNDFIIIGGNQIYLEFLERDLVDYIMLTAIKGNFNCDTFFPHLHEDRWRVFGKIPLDSDTTVIHFKRER